ncbi:MAG TPA: DUF2934 domain-containing protein [Bryobacteraceae bacterium]|nr:DUF2934 domain-containing protein [Bryobacteraceae bacterium]
MAKQENARVKAVSSRAGDTAAAAFDAVPEADGSQPDREEIARLAYAYWQARGCPHGSPEEDWLRAESDLQLSAKAASATAAAT